MPIYLDNKHEEVFKFWIESFDPSAHNVIVAKASNGGNTYIFSLTREDLGDRFFEKFCK